MVFRIGRDSAAVSGRGLTVNNANVRMSHSVRLASIPPPPPCTRAQLTQPLPPPPPAPLAFFKSRSSSFLIFKLPPQLQITSAAGAASGAPMTTTMMTARVVLKLPPSLPLPSYLRSASARPSVRPSCYAQPGWLVVGPTSDGA